MALIVTPGASNADSYASLEAAAAYHLTRGNVEWAAVASDSLREIALRRATDYMGQEYGGRWIGRRASSTQALDWPRLDVIQKDTGASYPYDTIPAAIERACAELALRSLSTPLLDDQEQGIAAVSAGSVSVTFRQGSTDRRRFPAVDGMLAELLAGRGQIALVRA